MPEKQPEHRSQSQYVYSERSLSRRADVAPDYAQRGHILELEKRRQGKPKQQHESRRRALQYRREARRRQEARYEAGEPQRDQVLYEEPEGTACKRRPESEQQKLPGEQGEELRLRSADAAHYGITIEVPASSRNSQANRAKSCDCEAPMQRITA